MILKTKLMKKLMTMLTTNLVVGGGGGGGAVERAGGGARPDLEPEVKSQELSAIRQKERSAIN